MAPPTRRQSSKEGGSGEKKKQQNGKINTKEKDEWMCILPDELIKGKQSEGGKQPSVCKLKHPRTALGTLYLISADESMVFQLHDFKEKYRSWFIGNKVCSDGTLCLTSPMDPLFLLLPYLMADEAKKFMTLDQLVCDEEFPDCSKLLVACTPNQVSLICDCKDIDEDTKVFRYNKEKTLTWLKKKTDVLADALEAKNVQVSSKGSHSSMFVRSKSAAASRESFVGFAHGIVSDYLCLRLEEELKTYLGIEETSDKDQESLAENEPPSKLKKHLKGNHYDSDEEVVAAVRQWCREQSPELFADGIRQLVRRWQLCVDRDGDYVEK